MASAIKRDRVIRRSSRSPGVDSAKPAQHLHLEKQSYPGERWSVLWSNELERGTERPRDRRPAITRQSASQRLLAASKRVLGSDQVKKAFLPTLQIGSVYFLFPLYPTVSIPFVASIIGSFCCWALCAPILKARLYAAGLLACGLGWAVLSPYFILDGPVYFYRAESLDARESRIIPIGQGAARGHLVYVADPIRAAGPVRRLMSLAGFAPTFLSRSSDHTTRAIVMPLRNAVHLRITGASSNAYAEALLAYFTGAQVAIEMFPTPDKSTVTLGPSLAASSFPVVEYIRNVNNSPGLDWSDVLVQPGAERETAAYSAEVDCAIEAASRGAFDVAIPMLEAAVRDSPSELERARAYAVLGFASAAVLGGNIGSVQAFAFFNQAMAHWPRVRARTTLSRSELDNSIDRWLFDSLKGVFAFRGVEYPTWSRVLGNSEKNVETSGISGSQKQYWFWWLNKFADTAVDSLIAVERGRLVRIVHTDLKNPRRLSIDLSNLAAGRPDFARWAFFSLLSESHTMDGHPEKIAVVLQPEWGDALEVAASLCPEPWKSQYTGVVKFMETYSAVVNSLSRQTDAEAQLTAQRWLHMFRRYGFPQTAGTLSSDFDGNAAPAKIPSPPRIAWWTREYIDWFGSVVGTMAKGISSTCSRRGDACEAYLDGVAARCARDGTGRLFAPGIDLVITFSIAINQAISETWVTGLRDATGMERVVWLDHPR